MKILYPVYTIFSLLVIFTCLNLGFSVFLYQLGSLSQNGKGRGSAFGIATHHELDGPEIKYRLGGDFPHSSRPVLGSTQPSIQWVPSLSFGVKRPGRGVNQQPPIIAEIKERVELYPNSLSGSS